MKLLWRGLIAFALVPACLGADEAAPPLAPSASITVMTNAPPGVVAAPLPAPATVNVATSQPTRVEMPSAYGLGNYYPQPTMPTPEDAETAKIRSTLGLPVAPPTPSTVPTAEGLFRQALKKPSTLPPPPAPRTLPTPVLSKTGTLTGSPLPVTKTNAPPAPEDIWKHQDKSPRDVEYHW